MGAIRMGIRRRLESVVTTAVRRALPTSTAVTDRAYFLALSEYQRRRVSPVPAPELAAHELRVSSQNGEDGVIQEILRRTGTSEHPFFVEFGVGFEGNAVLLADALGWSGLFLEADPDEHRALELKYAHGPVRRRRAMVTPENVQTLFEEEGVPPDPDILSIDIDGNDYWVWRALKSYRPRLVVIEYNAGQSATDTLVQEEDAGPWHGTDHFGASLGALVELARQKGYRLVHTDTTGVNAFFVRDDLPGEWQAPRLAGPNYNLLAVAHPPDADMRRYVTPSPS